MSNLQGGAINWVSTMAVVADAMLDAGESSIEWLRSIVPETLLGRPYLEIQGLCSQSTYQTDLLGRGWNPLLVRTGSKKSLAREGGAVIAGLLLMRLIAAFGPQMAGKALSYRTRRKDLKATAAFRAQMLKNTADKPTVVSTDLIASQKKIAAALKLIAEGLDHDRDSYLKEVAAQWPKDL